MNWYIEIHLRPDGTAPLNFLWERLYMQLHLAMVQVKNPDNRVELGCGFPQYDHADHTLGSTLRVFSASESELVSLNLTGSLSRLSDYLGVMPISTTPEQRQWRRYARIRKRTNTSRLVRRYAKRHGVSVDEAARNYARFTEESTDAPFINMRSLSGDKRFRLFIGEERLEGPVDGLFSCYGLSSEATVPHF